MAAITNYTGDGKQKSIAKLFCSSELAGGVHSQLIFFSVLNTFLSITACLGNTLILVALYKETSLHPPSKLLLRSLAATDLCACWYHCSTFTCYSVDFCSVRTVGYLSLYVYHINDNKPNVIDGVFVNTGRYKRRQTTCPVVRAQIQTSCNFKENICNCDCFLG